MVGESVVDMVSEYGVGWYPSDGRRGRDVGDGHRAQRLAYSASADVWAEGSDGNIGVSMKASQLVIKLLERIAEHGDQDVVVTCRDYYALRWFRPVQEVEVVHDDMIDIVIIEEDQRC